MKRNYPPTLLLSLGLIGVGMLLSVARPSFFESLDRKIYDLNFLLRGGAPPSGQVVLVTIDEKSLQEIGRWPWPRSMMADLFEEVIRRGARVVVPDIFFAEPSGGPEGDRSDRALAETLRRHPSIFLGYFFLMSPEEVKESALDATQFQRNFDNLSGSSLPFHFQPLRIRQATEVQDALSLFSRLPGGRRHGFFNTESDPDGTIRKTPLLMAYRDRIFPSLLLQVAMYLRGRWDPEFLETFGIDDYGDFLVNYRGGGSGFPRVSADDILHARKTISLEDKVVLIGATASGLEDNRPTPVDPVTPSVMLSAHLIDNLIQGDFLKKDWRTDLFSRCLLLISGLLLAIFLPRIRPMAGLTLFAACLLAESLLIHLLFTSLRWVVPGVYPLFSTFLVYGGTSLYGYLLKIKETQFIKGTFEHYLSAEVIQELTDHPDRVRLGGERKELTVFFSDIRDFTSIAETTPPEVLVDFLNHYLTPVTDVILNHKGLLDKYIGDAVMAVFGAPLPEPAHPRLACRAAAEIARLVRDSQAKWQEEFRIPRLRIGIGINTGPMTVGNMGSERRFDYTVIGDAVNQASRIEALNKYYGTTVLVSEATYLHAKNDFPFREIDQVQVKGKKAILRIFELVAESPDDSGKTLRTFSEGLSRYREGKFATAKALFESCLADNPSDGPARLFLDRCRRLEETPPADWTGITTFLEK